jgi:hypothetical protein
MVKFHVTGRRSVYDWGDENRRSNQDHSGPLRKRRIDYAGKKGKDDQTKDEKGYAGFF